MKIIKHRIKLKNLNRMRSIRVMLPPNYANSQKDYPVFYFQDGQNLFDSSHGWVAHTWGIDTLFPAL
jgi:predicted alpha/beta superfamily hydrolase